MKKKTSRFLSVILVLGVLIGSTSLTLLGASAHEIDPVELPQNKIVELTELRGENEKHFALPDGTIEAVAYGSAIHRQNSDGEWVDINNDLTLKTVNSKRLYSTADGRVSLAEYYEKNSTLLTLNENGYSVSMSFLDNQNNHISTEDMPLTAVDNAEYTRPESFDTLEEATRIDNRVSVNYRNVINNTDLEYILSGNDIKENIIVKSRADEYEYGFLLALGGLTATLQDSGRIILADEETEEEIYVIPAPYMYDANGVYSRDVAYELIHAGGDKYLLTITADKEWMDDEEREFPVTVDPTIQSSGTPSDTYINSKYPNNNYGSAYQLYIHAPTKVLINCSLPDIPSLATINYGKLFVSHYMLSSAPNTTVAAREILSAWNENTVTYNNQPATGDTILDTNSYMYSPLITLNTPSTTFFSITSVLEDHYGKGDPFYGIALYAITTNPSVIFIPHEMSSNYDPYISVNYTYLTAAQEESTYYLLSDMHHGNYMQISGDSSTSGASASVSVLSVGHGNHQKWKIIYEGDGYYKIISKYSGLALTGRASGQSVIHQAYAELDSQLWKILKTASGNYMIKSKTNDVLAITSTSTAGPIELVTYTNNSVYGDEWTIAKIGYMSETATLEGQFCGNSCWAASARMFAKQIVSTSGYENYGFFNANKSQEAAYNYVFNTYYNDSDTTAADMGFDIGDGLRAINYYLNLEQAPPYADIEDIVDIEDYAECFENQIFSETQLRNYLDLNQDIYIACGYLKYSGDTFERAGGHAILIYGYVVINGDLFYLIRDPLPENDGRSYLLSYNDLCSHEEYDPDMGDYVVVWEGSITLTNS